MAIISSLKQHINDVSVKRNIDVVLGGLNILNIDYDVNQNPIKIEYENNIKMFMVYDVNNNCTSLEVRDKNNIIIEKWEYTYTNNLLKTARKIIG